jgi:hypothetical protein
VGKAEVAAPGTPERIAHDIAWDDYATEANGYASWESNHSCGMGRYGCCGGGKDIDREALEKAIAAALASLTSELAQAREEIARLTAAPKYMPVLQCGKCGCLWRDNLDGTVSLFDAHQKSCATCENDPSLVTCQIRWLPMAPISPSTREDVTR